MSISKQYSDLVLKESGRNALKRRHPWIFSGAILHHSCNEGDVVRVVDKKGNFLAIGYYQNGSIAVRILSFHDVLIDETFWATSIEKAFNLRQSLDLPNETTNAFRLIHAEGDNLSGLIVDLYGDLAVVQCHTIGMHQRREDIAKAIITACHGVVKKVYDKSKNTLPHPYAHGVEDGMIIGEYETVEILENDKRFLIDAKTGQKTGFFLDQRDNRHLLGQMAKNRSVLNLYAYTGGFSMYAMEAGATIVTSVDASAKAIALLEKNAELATNKTEHQAVIDDVPHFLKECPEDIYDIIVVDPPAFAKSLRKRHNAVQAYKRVNAAAIQRVKKNGFLFTFSCSQVIDSKLFYDTITAAAIEAGRPCQVLHHLSQGADHPVSIFHPEGKYLKGLVLAVE
jgi:23S rRNA (cytosine1962-C5)-methyltransferase